MKTFHNEAKPGQIAGTVLMPGDPLRAKYIADTYLSDVVCYNRVRGMNGYTGYYEGKRISVQGSGMGIPSMGIYAYELYQEYDVDTIIRIGTAGAVHRDVEIGNLIFAQARSSGIPFLVGNVFSSDVFYEDRKGEKGEWEKMGVLAQEMETLSLYCTAARTGKRALAMLTVGSSIHHDRALSNEEREKNLDAMIRCALEIAG